MGKDYTVYYHENKSNGKRYVGITCNVPEYRWNRGKNYKNCVKFYNAIQKYEWNNFNHVIVAQQLSHQEACDLERKLIKEWKTQDNQYGYNICNGGNVHQISDETRLKMSKAHKGLCVGEKNPMYGKPSPMRGKTFSKEVRQHMSEAQRGLQAGEKNPMYGRKHTEESKKKMSEATKKWFETHDNPLKGQHLSKITREKISQARMGKYTGKDNPNAKKVICLNNHKIYDTILDAHYDTNVCKTSISQCCTGKLKSAGRHPITNERLHWMYYKDYLAEQCNNK